ncbi:unnamed protein product, partial [Allacma fusca]
MQLKNTVHPHRSVHSVSLYIRESLGVIRFYFLFLELKIFGPGRNELIFITLTTEIISDFKVTSKGHYENRVTRNGLILMIRCAAVTCGRLWLIVTIA